MIRYYLYWKGAGGGVGVDGLHLNKFESHTRKDALYHVWLKLAQLFWSNYLLNFVNVFFAISLSSPFGEVWGPSFEQI